MLNINFEFRKGIFFIRLIGDLNGESYRNKEKELIELITQNKFEYIVLNINYLTKMYYITKENKCNLIICDKFKIFKTLLNNNIPNIENELEVL